LRVPGIILLLGVGIALGPDGAGWIQPDALGEGLIGLVRLSVAIILFEGGLNLDIRRLRREGTAIRRLVTFGAAITGIGGALAARVLMDWSLTNSLLFGTLVIVTGPTVVTPLLRHLRLQRRVSTVLEAEGVLIDPVGALIAVLAIEIAVAPSAGAISGVPIWLIERFALGILAGAAFGFLLALLLRSRRIVPEGYENIVTLGGVVLLFAICRNVLPESGILATTIAGIVVGNMHTRVGRSMSTFEEQITVMLIGLLFILLAANVRLADVQALGWSGLAVVGALMFLVRPVEVFATTAKTELTLRDKLFISWIAPRGIVAAAVASLASGVLEEEGIPGGPELRALVFLTIAITVVFQAGTAGPVARLLRLLAPPRDAVVILGAEGLGLALANELRSAGRRVVFMDSNAAHCTAAESEGYPVVFGNALDRRVLTRAKMNQAAVAIGLTTNTAVNALFAREASEIFGVPDTYVAVDSIDPGVTPERIDRERGKVLFDGPKELGRWNVRFRHGEAPVIHFRYLSLPEAPEENGREAKSRAETWVHLTTHRDKKLGIMDPSGAPRPGDIGAFVLHGSALKEGEDALRAIGWERIQD
ncbi:MAG: cation:proton antiporter, partial [Myxococcota bacterium]